MGLLGDFLAELTSGDDERAEAAVENIAALGESCADDPIDVLQELLSSPDSEIRWWGVRTLASISDPRIVSILIKALADEGAAVRQCAALGLRLHPTPRAIDRLIDCLSDEDHLVVELSADALAEIGEQAVPALITVVEKGNPKARLEAVRTLSRIGDTRAIPVLFGVLDEGSALMEYWAAEGLERMGVGMVFYNPE
jgi:HEAT repeat protein